MQAEIVDDVNAHTDKAIEAFAKKAQENNQSPFSPENVNKLGSNHEYEKLNTLSKQFQNQLGTQHPLYPYYQFTPSQEYEGNLVSSPLRDDARKKYPPRFVLNGIAKIGDDKINELSPEIIEYANRHQLSISLEIHSATKYLGEEKDPIQTEAESLIGATLIKEPRKFSEPRPYSIRIDNTPIFDYIELGVSEILEDKSVVVTNEKQQSPLINIRLVFNVYTHNVSVSMTAVDHSNETLLRYVTLMKAASEGKNISLYDLKNNTVFLSGPLRDCDYKSGFSNVDDELDFLRRICEIEEHFSVKIKIPDVIMTKDYKQVRYLSDLLRGERVKRNAYAIRTDNYSISLVGKKVTIASAAMAITLVSNYIPTTGAEDIIKKAIVVVAGAVGAGVACLPDYLYVTSVLSMHKSVGKIYYVYENDYYLDSNKSQLIGHWTFRHRSGH